MISVKRVGNVEENRQTCHGMKTTEGKERNDDGRVVSKSIKGGEQRVL